MHKLLLANNKINYSKIITIIIIILIMHINLLLEFVIASNTNLIIKYNQCNIKL